MYRFRVFALAVFASALAAGAASAQKCSAAQMNVVKQAKGMAAGRVQSVYFAVTGVNPANHRRVNEIAQAMIGADIDKYNVDDVLRSMNATLLSPQLTYNCPAKSAKGCKVNAGFVEPGKYAINLCPRFFTDSAEQRVRTLVHESAHVAKVYVVGEEAYCVAYDCRNACEKGSNQWNTADNWSHFVHCASGQTPDKADSISAKPGKGAGNQAQNKPAKKK
jgi:hypothetical protein